MAQTLININGEVRDASGVTLPDDRTFREAWVFNGNTVEVDADKQNKILRGMVNAERTRRLEQGTTIEVTGYGSVAVQGRDQDQITVLALEASARDLTAAGVTDPVIPFRDRDNVQHMLTPDQTTELMRKAKAFAQQIYQASWGLKDADPVPQDYADDKHWP